MKNIIFSIVIPTYNSQYTIIQCLKSCLNQSYKNFEIIIVDDCSSDNTILTVEGYIKNNRLDNIKISRLDNNGGASIARNVGIKQAVGKYIALLDSDDFFHIRKLEIVHEILLNDDSIDLLGHDYYIEDEINNAGSTLDLSNVKLTGVSCNKLLLKNFAVTPSIVFKRSINMYFNEQMRYTEDHDFFLRVCFEKYKICYLNLKLVGLNRRLLSDGGQSSNNFKMRLGEIKMYINLYKIDYKCIFIIPILICFSIIKHIFRIINRNKNVSN